MRHLFDGAPLSGKIPSDSPPGEAGLGEAPEVPRGEVEMAASLPVVPAAAPLLRSQLHPLPEEPRSGSTAPASGAPVCESFLNTLLQSPTKLEAPPPRKPLGRAVLSPKFRAKVRLLSALAGYGWTGAAIEAGSIFGPYEVVREIGRGSRTAVFLCRDLTDRNEVALKAPLRDFRTFAADALLATRLDHPDIVRAKKLVTSPRGQLALILEPMADDLGSLVAQHPAGLPEVNVVDMLRAVCRALHHLRGEALSHGRLTPRNLLFDRDRRCRIAEPTLVRPASDLANSMIFEADGEPSTAAEPEEGGRVPDPDYGSDALALADLAVVALKGTRGAEPPAHWANVLRLFREGGSTEAILAALMAIRLSVIGRGRPR